MGVETFGQTESSGISSGIKLGTTAVKILEIIKSDSYVTAENIARQIGVGVRTVEKQISKLRGMGLLVRVGSPTKGGSWMVVEPGAKPDEILFGRKK